MAYDRSQDVPQRRRGEQAASMDVAHQGGVDGGGGEVEVRQFLGERQLGGHSALVVDLYLVRTR